MKIAPDRFSILFYAYLYSLRLFTYTVDNIRLIRL